MKSVWTEKEFTYDGTQLRSLFTYMNFKVQGDSILSWIGACNIPDQHIVDGEDLLAGEKICGSRMLHFIVENFNTDLFTAVLMQRLLTSIANDILGEKTRKPLRRDGDDLFFENGKLSISIATKSPVSALIHFAINISNQGTPVKTASLEDLGIEPVAFAKDLMDRFTKEIETSQSATTKVRPVN